MRETMEDILQENFEPKTNIFFAALAASHERIRETTPMQTLHSQLRDLQRVAQAGDIKEWQEKLECLQSSKAELNLAGLKELEIEVNVRKWEMTLLLRAVEKTKNQAGEAEKDAADAEQRGDFVQTRENLLKAQRLARLAQQLQNQLLSKLA